jgi:hypothetical protein
MLLMPKSPAAVGQTWDPTAEDVKKWLDSSPSAKRWSSRQCNARFKLVTAQKGLAVVEGNVFQSGEMNGVNRESESWMRWSIDTGSGRWMGGDSTYRSTGKIRDRVITSVSTGKWGYEFASGSGTPSAAPGWTNKIGWPKPPPDTNTFKDKTHRYTLNVPAAYTPIDPPANTKIVARFQCPETQAFIVVSVQAAPNLLDLEEAEAFGKEADKGYQVVSRTPIALSDNVPAVLIVGKSADGNLNRVKLVAVDGQTVFSVVLAAPTDQKVSVGELSTIAKSLRILGPEDE